jgi:hypothetical protein
MYLQTVLQTYIYSRSIPEGLAKTSQIFLRDTHILPNDLAVRNTPDGISGKPIAGGLQFISGVSAINSLVAFVLLF